MTLADEAFAASDVLQLNRMDRFVGAALVAARGSTNDARCVGRRAPTRGAPTNSTDLRPFQIS